MPYPIEKIVELISADRKGEVPATISWLLTDSRSLCFPEETLFFALKTKQGDGADYIPELYKQGVRNFVVAGMPENHKKSPDCNFLVVPNPLKALQKLAEQHRGQFAVPVVGITGSNGKTIVKEWLYQLLSPQRAIARSPRSYNSQIGVPLSVWQLNETTELGIFEAGISEPGEMRALQNIIQPTIGLLTNCGSAHQENFFSLQEKCMEKLTLFKNCEVVIYNGDDELVSRCVSQSMLTSREIAWSKVDKDKPLYIRSVTKDDRFTTVCYRYLGLERSYRIPFIDDASVENSINCLATCLYLLVPPETIAERMERLEPVAMRLEVKEGKNGSMIINDSYNSDLAALDIALDFLYRRSIANGLKRTLILSDIYETGHGVNNLYRKVTQLVHSRGVEKIIGVGGDIMSAAGRFNMEKYFFRTTDDLMDSGILSDIRNEIVLVKGARVFQFERISDELELKVHETILEVNLNALVNNLNYFKSKLSAQTGIICMVKASAYGAGAVEIARTLEEHRVDYLAVAVADEGTELRKAGITSPVIVMNPELSAFKTIFNYKLEPEVYSFNLLEALIKEAEKEGITHFPIHLKIDTGMHRLGFEPGDIPRLVERLGRQSALLPRTVFSHLAGSDSMEFDAFTRRQIDLFKEAADTLQQAFSHKILRHISNSAAAERFPDAQFDLVRLGIGLYGIGIIPDSRVRNVNTLKTTILQIRKVPEEETVGYSRKGVLTRESRIAILPIGYADGLNRKLGNGKGYCLVNGEKAPYVGNICMDISMIDVTDINCAEGDKVIIFGDELPVAILAEQLDTIPYEVFTSVSPRVKRIYFQD